MKNTLNILLVLAFIFATFGATYANSATNDTHKADAHQHTQLAYYACPMHPNVVGNAGDTCPDCGMYLAEKTLSEPLTYHCPMHPDIKGQKSDSCAKCGMNLTEIAQPIHEHHANDTASARHNTEAK